MTQIQIKLHDRQRDCFISEATEILYGGAAGGGKSHAMRVIAIAFAFAVPSIQIYLFRRLFSDLIKNHIEGPSGFRALLAPWVQSKHVKITEEEITFWNGAKIYLCHCQHEKDVEKYRGVEINLMLIDELTHFTEKIYRFLRSRVRLGSLKVPAEYKNKLPRIIASSNPGGIGHDFVKDFFISSPDAMSVRRMSDEEGGMLRQFIPAKLADNPTMTANDPLYAAKLQGLGGALAKAMLEGDWDAIEGAFFDKFNKAIHVVEPFKIPNQLYKIRAFDWGYARPFSVGWYAVSDGREFDGYFYPAGALIKYREWYGGIYGKNEGLRMENNAIARGILKLEGSEKIDDSVADPSIFAENGGESIANQMHSCGVTFRRADNERIGGWQQIRYRFDFEEGDRPMFFIFKTCPATIGTLSTVQHDQSRPEDLDTDMEDHAADETRYACNSRPLTVKIKQQAKREDNVIYIQDQIEILRKRIRDHEQQHQQ